MGQASLVMGVVAALFERHRPLVLDLPSVSAVLYLAVAGSAVTFVLYFWLLQHMPATRLSLIAYGVPVVAVLVGWAFLDEVLTLHTLVGSALVIAGVALAVRRNPRSETSS
jgi:drug/metabolite transporter (DMT)-like permease